MGDKMMIRSIDWTITGVSAGVAILAGAVAYEAFVLISSGSGAEPAKDYHLASVSTSVLIPARDRPAASVTVVPAASAPVAVFAPNPQQPISQQASRPMLTPGPEAELYPPPNASSSSVNTTSVNPSSANRWESPQPAATDNFNSYPSPNTAGPAPRRNPPMPQHSAASFNDYPPPIPAGSGKRASMPMPMGTRLSDRLPPQADYASLPRPEPKALPMAAELWRVETTPKANYFNLGGHVDRDGVVDSLASSYLRDALKKHRNFVKLPPQIKAYVEAPTINLAKIAGYRAMLGIDDRKMEEEQGVKFVRVASRGVDLTNPGNDADDPAADGSAPPLDLNPLQQMLLASRQK
jgi:hypothetical protein